MYFKRKRRLRRQKNGRRAVTICFAFMLAIVLVMVVVINPRLKSIVRVYAENAVERICLEAINNAADSAIENSNITYNDIVKIEKSADNSITAVMADIGAVNRIKTQANRQLLSTLAELDGEEIRIPLGTLTDNSLFIGRGPDISVRVQLTGNSEVEIRSVFESVGINQTRHSVNMDIECRVYIVMLGVKSAQDISLSVPIAETIIVGTVPDTFLSLSK